MRVSDIVSCLKQCSSLKHIRQTHGVLVPRGFHNENLILAQFIQSCSSLGYSSYAYLVFTHNKRPNVYLFNTMINLVSPPVAVSLYNKLLLAGLRPDTYTFPFVLKAVVKLSAVEVGRQIHCQALGTGLLSDVNSVTALVRMYSCCGSILDARKIFDEMSCFRDAALWNAMVAGYVKAGDVDNARKVFEDMPERNLISWTFVIAGYSQMKRPEEAIIAFKRMQLENVEADEVVILALLCACGHLGSLQLGERIHNYIQKRGFSRKLTLNNALIDMYAKSGSIRKAINVFESVNEKSVVTWTTMLAGLALHGLGREASELFSRMENAQVKPNDITFIALLSACRHSGLVETGHWYFNNMDSRYGIQPKIEHYGCMIDLLGRGGYLQEACELVKAMPFEANAAIWGSLLGASNMHGNAELGQRALHHLMMLEPQNSGSYMLLSNVYASLDRWDKSGMVRKFMRDTGVKKMTGGSFIEVNNRVHRFIAGDTSHTEFNRIFAVVCNIFYQLKGIEILREERMELLEFDG